MEIHEHPLSWEALGAFVVIITLVLTASLHPLVHSLHKKTKIPVLLCTFIILLILLIPFAIIGLMIIPNLVNGQLPELFMSIDVTLKHLPLIGQYFTNFSIVHYLESYSSSVLASSSAIAMTVFSIISKFILTFYFVYDYERL